MIFYFNEKSICKMLEHNTSLTHLSVMGVKLEKRTIDCIVKLTSLIDIRINGECAAMLFFVECV